MANATTPQVVRSYLAQLEKALADVPAEVRHEIVAGVAEELSSLDTAAAAARIELLGDPEFIAAGAREEAGNLTAGSSLGEPVETQRREQPREQGHEPREPGWYPVLAALLVAFGGILIPVIGWVVGLAMVCISRTWTRVEKLVAVITPVVAVAAITLITLLTRWFQPASDADPSSGFQAPNPLMPAPFDLLWSGVVLFGGVNVVVGIWLLWRAKRAWAESSTQKVVAPVVMPQASWYPVVTVLLIIGGGYLIPFVGWVAGVTMLWGADVWSSRQKWLGTVAGPFAAGGFLLLGGAIALIRGDSAFASGLAGWHLMLLAGIVLPLIANLIVGIRLLRKANSGDAPAPSEG